MWQLPSWQPALVFSYRNSLASIIRHDNSPIKAQAGLDEPTGKAILQLSALTNSACAVSIVGAVPNSKIAVVRTCAQDQW